MICSIHVAQRDTPSSSAGKLGIFNEKEGRNCGDPNPSFSLFGNIVLYYSSTKSHLINDESINQYK